jgi:hypothetical protein
LFAIEEFSRYNIFMPTLIVKRLIKPGFEHSYEHSLSGMVDEAEQMEGYLGANVARPGNKKNPLYIFSIKFDTQKHLQAYKDSSLRQKLLKEWHEQSQKPIDERTIKSIDWWFILPEDYTENTRYKMILVSIIAAYPVVLILNIIITGTKNIEETAVKILLLVIMTILIMNFVTMPFFLNLLKNWLKEELFKK